MEFSDTINLMNKITTKVEEVEKHLQFTIVLAMFFPVLVEALFSLGEYSVESVSRTTLGLGASISILIMSYILFEWRKNKLTNRVLKYLNWTFFATIICYACIFLLLSQISSTNTSTDNRFMYYVFKAALYGLLYIPFASFAILMFDFAIKKSETI